VTNLGLIPEYKKIIIPPTPLTDQQVTDTLAEMEHAIRFRLRVADVIPVEMLNYRIVDGRVFFTAPKLFEASLFLGGSQPLDGWFFANVQFLFTVGGDLTGTQGNYFLLVTCYKVPEFRLGRISASAYWFIEEAYNRRGQRSPALLYTPPSRC
jgi:Mediator complex subunit MED14